MKFRLFVMMFVWILKLTGGAFLLKMKQSSTSVSDKLNMKTNLVADIMKAKKDANIIYLSFKKNLLTGVSEASMSLDASMITSSLLEKLVASNFKDNKQSFYVISETHNQGH